REIFKEWRLVNVIALLVPLINFAGARRNFIPLWVLIREIAVKFTEHFWLERRLHRIANLSERRPKIAQEGFFPVFVFADRLFAEIDIDTSGERERDYQR